MEKFRAFFHLLLREERLCGVAVRGSWPAGMRLKELAVGAKRQLQLDVRLWCQGQEEADFDRFGPHIHEMISDLLDLRLPLRSLTFAHTDTLYLTRQLDLLFVNSATLCILDFSHCSAVLAQMSVRQIPASDWFSAFFPLVETVILSTDQSALSAAVPRVLPFLAEWFPALSTLVFSTDDLQHLKLLPKLPQLQNLRVWLRCGAVTLPRGGGRQIPKHAADTLTAALCDIALAPLHVQPKLINVEWIPQRGGDWFTPKVLENFSKIWLSRVSPSEESRRPVVISVRSSISSQCPCEGAHTSCLDCEPCFSPDINHSACRTQALF